MKTYEQHFYGLAMQCNATRLTHGEDRTLAVDNSIMDSVLNKLAIEFGFTSYPAMFRALGEGVELVEYMEKRSKHLPINQVEQVVACERVDNWKGRNGR